MFKTRIIILLAFCLASTSVHAGDFALTSPTIKADGFLTEKHVFNGFGCTGQNISPALKVQKMDVPTDSSPALIASMIASNSLGKASFTAMYGR